MNRFNFSRGDKFEEAFYSGLLRNLTFAEIGREFNLRPIELQRTAFDRGWITSDFKGQTYLPIQEILRREQAYRWATLRGISLCSANKKFGFPSCTLESFARARGYDRRTTPTHDPEKMKGVVERYLRELNRGEISDLLKSIGFRIETLTKPTKSKP